MVAIPVECPDLRRASLTFAHLDMIANQKGGTAKTATTAALAVVRNLLAHIRQT